MALFRSSHTADAIGQPHQWRAKLSPAVYQVLRKHSTERAGTSALRHGKAAREIHLCRLRPGPAAGGPGNILNFQIAVDVGHGKNQESPPAINLHVSVHSSVVERQMAAVHLDIPGNLTVDDRATLAFGNCKVAFRGTTAVNTVACAAGSWSGCAYIAVQRTS